MDAIILPRKGEAQPLTFEGKTVVLLHSESGTYREWDVQIARTWYSVIDDDGDWTLLRQDPDSRDWLDDPQDVDAFLATHRLILSA